MALRLQHDHTDQAMNIPRTSSKICALLLLAFLPSSFAANRAPDRNEDIATILLGLERSRFSAQQQKDTASLNAILDEGLLWVDQDGSLLTKAALLARLHDAHHTVVKILPETITVRTFATVAMVIGIYDETSLEDGHVFHRRCRFIDTWAWKKGKWVCIAATATSTIS
jgi:hypothetical protein